jgi:RecB family endonuclease NucS
MLSAKRNLTLENPGIDRQTAQYVRDALRNQKILLLVGNCWADYEGRASSKLEPGERIVLVKQDRSVLVHRPTGYEAVNWQPSGCVLHTSVKNGVLKVRAIRRRPAEGLSITFDRLILVSAMKLEDSGEFSLHATEMDMQKAVLMKPQLIEDGFKPISFEKKTAPGFVDVYGTDGQGNLVVIEIKRKTAGRNAVLQLSRYVDAVEEKANRRVRGILAAPKVAKGAQKLLVTLGLAFRPLKPDECAEILRTSETRSLAEFF